MAMSGTLKIYVKRACHVQDVVASKHLSQPENPGIVIRAVK
jgi:hypothetical protein